MLVAITVCTTGVCIHSLVARTFFMRTARSMHTSHTSHACHTHAWLKCLLKGCLHVCHVSPSRLLCLMFHQSFAVSVRLSLSLSTFPVHTFLPYLLVLNAQGMRISPRGREVWLSGQVRPQHRLWAEMSSTRSLLWTVTTMLINDLNHNFSDFSNTHENIGLFSVLTVFESSISHVSHNDFVLPKESREIMQSGNRCWIERERKEKVLWSVLQSRCQRKVDGTVSVWVWRVTENFVLKSLRKFYSGGRDLRDQWRAQQAIVGENSDQRRWYLTEYNMAIQNLKRRISQHALFESQRELESQRQQLLEANQSELNEREYICVADWGWRFIFIKNAMQVVAEKWKNWKVAALKEGNHLKQDWLNFLRSMIRNHEQWVYSSTIQTYRAVMTVPTFLIKLSLPRVQECLAAKLECCEIHVRIWVFLETFLIVNMLDEILMNYTMVQEIWRRHLAILRKEGMKNSGSEEPLQSILQ